MSTRFRAVSVVAVLVSLSLHGLVFAPVLLGMPSHYGRSRDRASAPSRPGDVGEFVSTAIILDETRHGPDLAIHLPLMAVKPPTGTMPDLGSDLPTPQVDFADAENSVDPAQETADPFQTYIRRMGALTSRLQRAWTLPPQRLTTDFHCRVRINQDEAGTLGNVEFQRCDADEILRASLLQAFHSAAPLPALGDSQKSGRGVTLDFAAFALAAGGRRTSVQPGAGEP